MVINIGALKSGDLRTVERDIEAVVEPCRQCGAISKVIIEAALLTDDEKITACTLSKAAGADFVKTSTGFASGGATAADVALMRRVVGAEMGVKAAGGVRDLEGLKAMVAAGATRVGASAGVKIVQESKGQKPAPRSRRPATERFWSRRLGGVAVDGTGNGIANPCCANALMIRRRSSRPTTHCFSGTVLIRAFIFTDQSPNESTPSTSIGARMDGPERRVRLQLRSDLAHHRGDAVGVVVVRHREIDDVVREVLAAIRQRVDRAVRKHVNRALDVAQDDRPEVDRLDDAVGAVDRRGIADADLILENQEEPADDVAHERLRAESNCQPGDPGAGQHRRDVQPEQPAAPSAARCRSPAPSSRSERPSRACARACRVRSRRDRSRGSSRARTDEPAAPSSARARTPAATISTILQPATRSVQLDSVADARRCAAAARPSRTPERAEPPSASMKAAAPNNPQRRPHVRARGRDAVSWQRA